MKTVKPMSIRELLEAILEQLEMMNEEKTELEKRISMLETPEPLLTRAEAARYCGVTPATITNWERRAHPQGAAGSEDGVPPLGAAPQDRRRLVGTYPGILPGHPRTKLHKSPPQGCAGLHSGRGDR